MGYRGYAAHEGHGVRGAKQGVMWGYGTMQGLWATGGMVHMENGPMGNGDTGGNGVRGT